MAEHTHSGPAELGAPMDYAEHEQTFASFVSLTKITTLACVAILQALRSLRHSANGGFWLGVLLIVLMMVAAAIGLMLQGQRQAAGGRDDLGFVLRPFRRLASAAMRIAVLKEDPAVEPRVAATPETVKKSRRPPARAWPSRRGQARPPAWPTSAIAKPAPRSRSSAAEALRDADLVLKVRRPDELAGYKRGAAVVALMDPYGNEAALQRARRRRACRPSRWSSSRASPARR